MLDTTGDAEKSKAGVSSVLILCPDGDVTSELGGALSLCGCGERDCGKTPQSTMSGYLCRPTACGCAATRNPSPVSAPCRGHRKTVYAFAHLDPRLGPEITGIVVEHLVDGLLSRVFPGGASAVR